MAYWSECWSQLANFPYLVPDCWVQHLSVSQLGQLNLPSLAAIRCSGFGGKWTAACCTWYQVMKSCHLHWRLLCKFHLIMNTQVWTKSRLQCWRPKFKTGVYEVISRHSLEVTDYNHCYYICCNLSDTVTGSGELTIVQWHKAPAEGAPQPPYIFGRGRIDSTVLIYS